MAIVYGALLVYVMVEGLHLNDFGKFYYDARAFLAGEPMYGTSPATLIPITETDSKHLFNLNPPHFHLLVLPLGWLEPRPAIVVWLVTGLAAFAVAARWSIREARLRLSRDAWLVLGLVLLASSAIGGVLVTGQITLHLLLVVAWMWIAARREHWLETGFILGLALSVKPFFAIFLPWLALRGRPVAVAVSLLTGAAALGSGVLIFGIDNFAAWLSTLQKIDWYGAPLNASLRGFLARSLAATPYFEALAHAPRLALGLWGLGAGTIGVVTLAVVLRERGPGSIDRAFAALPLAAVLMSPLGWVYYLPLALPAALGLVAARRASPNSGAQRRRLGAALLTSGLVLLCIPTAATMLGQPSPLLTLSLGSAHFWSALLLWSAALAGGRTAAEP